MFISIIVFCFQTGEHCTEHTVSLRKNIILQTLTLLPSLFLRGTQAVAAALSGQTVCQGGGCRKASGASWRANKAQQHHTSTAGTAATDKNSFSKTFYSACLRSFLGDFLLTSYSFTLSFNDCELCILEFPCVMPVRSHTLQFVKTKLLFYISALYSPPFILMLLSDKAEGNKKMTIVVKYQQQHGEDEKDTKKNTLG